MYQALSDEQTKTLISMIMLEKNETKQFAEITKKILDEDFLCKVIKKRIEAFKLPKFSDSAIIFISLMTCNAGKTVLAIIETLEAFQKNPDKEINLEFICEYVYPLGFYTQEAFEKEWDKRTSAKREGFNFLI